MRNKRGRREGVLNKQAGGNLLEINKPYILGDNTHTYLKLRTNNDAEVHKNLLSLIKKHSSSLNSIIQNAIEKQKSICVNIEAPNDLEFRPIIAGFNSPTSHVSRFLDLTLKPLLCFVKSNRVGEPVPEQ